MTKFFLSHPQESFNAEALIHTFHDMNEGSVRQMMGKLAKRNGVLSPVIIKDTWKKHHYKLNPEFKTLEQIREDLTARVTGPGQRVFQSDRPFNPVEAPITDMETPTLPVRRLFFRSILDRMQKSDLFTTADIELLKGENPALSEPDKKT